MEKLKLGFLNLMPNAVDYAALIRRSLASVEETVDFYPVRLRSREYRGNGENIDGYFDEVVRQTRLDLLLVTGAPVEHLPFEEIRYWNELCDIFAHAQAQRIPVMGICFGGLAIGKYLGIEKRILPEKLFGVYRMPVTAGHQRYLGAACTSINLAMSTWAILDETQIAGARHGPIKRIAWHPNLGSLMLATPDDQFVMILGHPEYTADVLQREWLRDTAKGILYTKRFDESDFPEMERLLSTGAPPILANWVRSHAKPLRISS